MPSSLRLDVRRMETELCPDPSALERLRSLGGATLLQKMVRLFIEHTPKRILAAVEGEKAGNWYQVERAAHILKSSAATLGLAGIQALAGEVEELAERSQSEGMIPLLSQIDHLFPLAKAHLQSSEGLSHA